MDIHKGIPPKFVGPRKCTDNLAKLLSRMAKTSFNLCESNACVIQEYNKSEFKWHVHSLWFRKLKLLK